MVVLSAAAPAAHATYEITVAQVGSNVVVTGSCAITLTGLTDFGLFSPGHSELYAASGEVAVGSPSDVDLYSGFSGPGPDSFETGHIFVSSSDTGEFFSVQGRLDYLTVPAGDTSASDLGISTSTYDNSTIASLNLNPGVYTWTLPEDSITLTIPASVPEPPAIALMVLPLAGLWLLALGRRLRTSAVAPPKLNFHHDAG